jgi:hypothetical protein
VLKAQRRRDDGLAEASVCCGQEGQSRQQGEFHFHGSCFRCADFVFAQFALHVPGDFWTSVFMLLGLSFDRLRPSAPPAARASPAGSGR